MAQCGYEYYNEGIMLEILYFILGAVFGYLVGRGISLGIDWVGKIHGRSS